MIRKLLVVLMCLTALSANARQVITGSLTDKETQKPVEKCQCGIGTIARQQHRGVG